MPKVPERNLSYGEILAHNRKLGRFKDTTPGTKQFPKTSFKEPRKNSNHGAVKTVKPAKMKWNPKDKTIGQDWYNHNQHLRSILNEE